MKRKTLAILLTVLLVVSAVLVLTACKKEYTVTFREANSKKIEEVTTVKGIATPSEKTTKKAGYTLEGWYKTVDADEEGRYIFKDKVDITTTIFKEDTDLYANWTRNISKGEEEGYCLIGIIGGVTNWDPEERAADEDVQFTYPGDPVNLYTITLDLKGLDEIKVKTSYKDWGTKEINYGGEKVTSITKAANATLPTGVENVEDLFTLDGNIGIMCDMNVTIKFFYAGKLDSYIEIVVNSTTGDIVKPVAEVGFIAVGTITKWAESIAADNTALAKYILKTEDNKIFTATGIELAVGDEFKFKVNENGWGRGEYGFGKISVVEFADSVTDRPDVDEASEVFGGEGDKGNISVKYAMTVNITFDYTEGAIAIEITEIDPTAPKADEEIGFFVACTLNNFYNAGAVEAGDAANGKYVMTADAQNAKLFTLTGLKLSAGQAFRIKLNQAGWSGTQYNFTNAKFQLGTGVTAPEGITVADMFEDAGEGMDNHNIIIKGVNLTIDISLDTSAEEEQLVITITEVEIAKTDDELGYIVVGDPTAWVPGIEAGSDNAAYIMTPDATNTHLFTYGSLTLLKNKNFRVKVNNNAWSGNIGYDKATFVFAAGVEHEGIENASELFKDNGGDHNIQALAKSVTVTLSLNTEDGQALTVTVTAFEPDDSEPVDPTKLDIELVGTVGGETNWDNGPRFTGIDEKTATINVTLKKGDSFKIRTTGNWDGGVNADGLCIDTVTLGDDITGPDGVEDLKAYFFEGTKFDGGGNITIAHGFTATLTYSTTNYKLQVVITAIEDESSTTTPEVPTEPTTPETPDEPEA